MKQKHYLVTGAAGFIGSRVCQLLIDRGAAVTGLDNLNDYYLPALKQHRLDALQRNPTFTFHCSDICDREALRTAFSEKRFDAVVNLAARAGVRYSKIDPHIYVETNMTGTLNLLEQMKETGVTDMLLASTSSLYAGCQLPYSETLPVNEPLSPYAASKKGAEALCYSYHHLYNFNINILRYFTVYGPAGRPDMSYFRFIHWIETEQPILLYGSGEQSRDFTFVSDIAEGTVRALDLKGHNIINLGGGNNPVPITFIIKMLEKMIGKSAIIKILPKDRADMDTTWADISKAKDKLNWEPQTDLQNGLQQCVDWYRQNRELAAAALQNLK